MGIQDLACTLEGPELMQRVQDWRALATRATGRSFEGNTVIATYPRDAELIAELRRLIEAEKDCCSFMQFSVEEISEAVTVRLRVPEEMKHLLGLMVGIAT